MMIQRHQAHSDDHVQSVQAGHRPVQREVNLGVLRIDGRVLIDGLEVEVRSRELVIFPVLVILNPLDSEEAQAEQNRNQQQDHHQLGLARLGCADPQRHGQRAANQYGGIGRSQPDVHLLAAFDEGLIVRGTVHQVGGEQPAEEHDLGQQEHPHAEGRGLLLLLHVGKVVLQRVLSDLDIASGQR